MRKIPNVDKTSAPNLYFIIPSRTNELCNRVVFSLCADGSCDAVILQDGQKELNKVWRVGRRNHIQHL